MWRCDPPLSRSLLRKEFRIKSVRGSLTAYIDFVCGSCPCITAEQLALAFCGTNPHVNSAQNQNFIDFANVVAVLLFITTFRRYLPYLKILCAIFSNVYCNFAKHGHFPIFGRCDPKFSASSFGQLTESTRKSTPPSFVHPLGFLKGTPPSPTPHPFSRPTFCKPYTPSIKNFLNKFAKTS